MSHVIRTRIWSVERKAHLTERDFDDGFGLTIHGEVASARQSGFFPLSRQSPYVVEQFTGLKDRNGVDIFEGDIFEGALSIMGGPDIEWRGTVTWDEARARFVAVNRTGAMRELPLLGGCEVIGNVHEEATT